MAKATKTRPFAKLKKTPVRPKQKILVDTATTKMQQFREDVSLPDAEWFREAAAALTDEQRKWMRKAEVKANQMCLALAIEERLRQREQIRSAIVPRECN